MSTYNTNFKHKADKKTIKLVKVKPSPNHIVSAYEIITHTHDTDTPTRRHR